MYVNYNIKNHNKNKTESFNRKMETKWIVYIYSYNRILDKNENTWMIATSIENNELNKNNTE